MYRVLGNSLENAEVNINMQEISLENLKKLLPTGQVDESLFNSAGREDIGGGLKFKDVCRAYDRQMDRLEYENGEYGTDRLRP